MKAYSYIRFSTKDQIKGNSEVRQVERAEKWCKDNKIELVQTYKDLGVSAYRGKNAAIGQLSQFLKLVQSGRVPVGSYLVVENLDRLSRNSILEAQGLFTRLITAGIKVVTLTDGQVYDRETITKNPLQLIISITVMTRAHDESERKSDLVSSAWAAKRKRIMELKMTAKCPGWLRLAPDRKSFTPIPERVAIVRQMFSLYCEGKGFHQIAGILRKQKTPSFNHSKHWHKSFVRRVISSRSVIGEFTPRIRRDGKVKELDPIPGYYPAVVPLELFAMAQQILQARPKNRSGRTGSKFVFSKLAYDAETGSLITRVSAGEKYSYLLSTSAQYGDSKFASWNYEDFKAKFLGVCHRAALDKHEPMESHNAPLAIARQQLTETDAQIARLIDYIANGESVAVEQRLRDLERQKALLREQINTLETDAAAKPKDVSEVDWENDEALRENLLATVKRIEMNARTKWFRVDFFDGRYYEFQQHPDGTATISIPRNETL